MLLPLGVAGGVEARQVSIREAAPGLDEDLLRRLRASVGWSTAETGLASMVAGRSVVYLLEMDGRPAGSGALVLRSDDPDLADGRARALISNLIVEGRHQGMGLGTRILQFLEEEAARRGFGRIFIGVDSPNVRARGLYERHGYETFKKKQEAWGPVIYLGKVLPATTR